MKTVAIIQARMNSERLPGKVLLPLGGHPVLWWMVKRASLAKEIDEIVIATSFNKSNKPIENFWEEVCNEFKNLHLHYFSGKEDDVIGRVLAAARCHQADIIVDLTADCPMVDPRHMDQMIRILKANRGCSFLQYISNCVYRNWPDGLDIQVYKYRALKHCIDFFAPKKHAGWNIADHSTDFHVLHWPAPKEMNWPELGLTLDTKEDYEMLSHIFSDILLDEDYHVEDVIKILQDNPELITNQHIKRKSPEEG